jgi:hypothetical protein
MDAPHLNIVEIREKVVAIVMFGPGGFATDGFKPAEYYQVTIDPQCISPSGKFVRFGENPGDEIRGWQRCAAMSVVEILGKWDDDKPPQLQYGTQNVVGMMSPCIVDAIAAPQRKIEEE